MAWRSSLNHISILLVVTLTSGGCLFDDTKVPAEKFQQVQRHLQAAQERAEKLDQQTAAQAQTIRELREQVAAIREVEGDPAEVLIVPERIELASLSGGFDEDGKAGDDGLVLYIQPFDRDGHVVKAAGTITVKLLDPQAPAGSVAFASYHFDAEHTRRLWYGRLMTNHFSVKCRWPEGHRPAHDEIIAHVTFTELITGRALTATETYKVTFEPEPEAKE